VSALDVWLYGLRVATVKPADTGVDLTWSDEAVDRWGWGSRTVSHLLPVGVTDRTTPLRARVWLEGLLPEGGARSRLAVDSRIDPDDTLAFLSVYGKDTAGGLVFVEEGAPDASAVRHHEPVDDEEIAAMLRHAESRSASAVDRSGLTSSSLAGMEPKIALARTPDGWARPLDGAPSTHIVKISRPEGSPTADLVDTEAAALHLARMVGLGTVEADVVTFAGMRALVVSRYDRVAGEDRTDRIHQEDLAQALGIDTVDPDRKFQRGERAMPSYRHAARVLADGLSSPDRLLALAVLTVVVGNTDAHAKNHSFLRLPDDGRVELAPAYDISMHEHTSVSSGALAMKIAGKSAIAAITADDLVEEGRSWGMAPRRATRVVAGAVEALRDALDTIDRDAHPGVSSHAWDVVTARAGALGTLAPAAPPPRRRGPRG
jgi:serine/threonine-protein kinase HipA